METRSFFFFFLSISVSLSSEFKMRKEGNSDTHTATWMDLEDTMLSEIRHRDT